MRKWTTLTEAQKISRASRRRASAQPYLPPSEERMEVIKATRKALVEAERTTTRSALRGYPPVRAMTRKMRPSHTLGEARKIKVGDRSVTLPRDIILNDRSDHTRERRKELRKEYADSLVETTL